MKKLYVFIFLTMFISVSSAQESSQIAVIDGKYYHNDLPVKNGQIKSIVENVPEAYRTVKKGCARNTTGIIFGGFGGAMLGMSLADAIKGTTVYSDDPVMGIILGTAFIGTGVWLSFSGAKKIALGVDIYNNSFTSGYRLQNFRLQLGATQHGVGLTCIF